MARQEEPRRSGVQAATPPSWVMTRTGSATASAFRRRRRRRLDIHSGTSDRNERPSRPSVAGTAVPFLSDVTVSRATNAGMGHTGVGSLRAMAEEARSESDLPIRRAYGPDDLAGFDPATQLGEPGEYPVHPRRVPVDVHRAAVDDAAVRRVRHREGVQRALPPAGRGRHRRPVASPSTCRPRWATTPTSRSRTARSARSASPSTPSTTCGPVRRAAARRDLDVDDDQRARLDAAAALPAGRGGARASPATS